MESIKHKGRTKIERIAVIGNYIPRQCGIATFTTDLCESLAGRYGSSICFAIPVTEPGNCYTYPPRVRFEIAEDDISSYRRVTEFLNINSVDIVCLQHEFGIFGGPSGSHILALLKDLRMPVVTTLHTILKEPNAMQQKVMSELDQFSDRFVVMSQKGKLFLREVYNVHPKKIDIIPHGIPDVSFVDPNFYKDRFGVEGKHVLLTFGLISLNKGLENVIRALPAILERYKNVVYIILGATHPTVLKNEGDTYRMKLQALAQELGVAGSVFFHNRFVPLDELVEFIGAADVYITPYLNEAQIVSGTLAYAAGMGKAIISTPYWYATELLADNRGMLVPFHDAEAIARSVVYLLEHEAERHAMRKNAYLQGRNMVWEKVAEQYMNCFACARDERTRHTRAVFQIQMQDKQPDQLLPISLKHIKQLTDDTGILQHSVYSIPNPHEGYTTDDNARALLLMTLLRAIGHEEFDTINHLAVRYMSYLWFAFNFKNRRFRNFLSYERRWVEDIGSEDSHGRALWALGSVLGRSEDNGLRNVASRLFEMALPPVKDFTSLRSWAFTLLGIHEYLRKFAGDYSVSDLRKTLAGRIMNLYHTVSSSDWQWFENIVAYANASIPHALLLCGQWIPSTEMCDVGLKTLKWLSEIQTSQKGFFSPIGSDGFYPRNGHRAAFDQQPIEAHAMVAAALEAFRVTNDNFWQREARRAFNWFLGNNDLELALYDPSTEGCCDGLHKDRVNQNQGAESTLSFLLALGEMRLSQNILDATYEQPRPQKTTV
jgi:glycosyltransferase involved in cell wall biosynthesis